MIFDASHALRFINEARAATGLPALTELPFTGAVRVDERGCLLARALQAEVGGSADPRFRDHFVARLGDQTLACAIASRTGQPCNDHAEVVLPDPLARLAVAFDRGQVEPRGASYVALGQLSFDDLETSAGQAATDVGGSSAVTRPRESTDPRRPGTRGPANPPSVAIAPIEQALSVVHHYTISAAHGAGPAVSGPGRIGRRPGRPSFDDRRDPLRTAPNQPPRRAGCWARSAHRAGRRPAIAVRVGCVRGRRRPDRRPGRTSRSYPLTRNGRRRRAWGSSPAS